MAVIAFHSDIAILSGGYIGVDVFFVISGYLITTLIFKEIKLGAFTFRGFYTRRAARLLPALIITLFFVLLFGLIFYNTQALDNLGKELFFSAFGAANILFAQGVNYFAKDEAYQPLIHLWSLGVEEQFYVVWPAIFLLTLRLSHKWALLVACCLCLLSLVLSVFSVSEGLTKGYFLLHFRAFELLVGVITALLLLQSNEVEFSDSLTKLCGILGFGLIAVPAVLLDENSRFPGFNALWPCLGAALVIAFPGNGVVSRVLSYKALVLLGLISYPLYLFHQPVISFFRLLDVQFSSVEMFLVVTLISVAASWLTYTFVETPIRQAVRSDLRWRSRLVIAALVFATLLLGVIGAVIAKTGGFESRFRYLNPFAIEISEAHSFTFHENFMRGFDVSPTTHSDALFVGDSSLEQYVLPFTEVLSLDFDDIDSVTRGGCVLLKDVEFVDTFSDISCNDIRDKLYRITKRYDYVVISQAWASYDASVLNFANETDDYKRWSPLLDATIEHFSTMSEHIIIVGAHPVIDGTLKLQPSVTVTQESYIAGLHELEVSNINELNLSREFFSKYEANDKVSIVEPYRIFCSDSCALSDGVWSYFVDSEHLSSASTEFVVGRMRELLD